MYAGFGTNYCDRSLEPTQELSVTLVTLHRVCSVTLVTLHRVCSVTSVALCRGLFCHYGDLPHEFVLNSPVR